MSKPDSPLPDNEDPSSLIHQGSELYKDADDAYCSPYTVVLDEAYAELCPWAAIQSSGHKWSKELTDLAVKAFGNDKSETDKENKS